MTDRAARLRAARQNRHAPLVAESLLAALRAEIQSWTCDRRRRREAWAATINFVTESLVGERVSVQQWWEAVESECLRTGVRGGRALVTGRFVQPSWVLVAAAPIERWVRVLPADDPLPLADERLTEACARISWASPTGRARAVRTGIGLMVAGDYDQLSQLREDDLRTPARGANGTDILDAALCDLGVFTRSPRRGTTRQAAQLARSLIANHDKQARSAHHVASEVADHSALPVRARSLLWRRADAMQRRRATYRQWCDAVVGLNINDGRSVDDHIDRSQDKDVGYEAGL